MKRKSMAWRGGLMAGAILALQACVLSSEKPLVRSTDDLRPLPAAFTATEMESPHRKDRLSDDPLVYAGRLAEGKYALLRQGDDAALDVRFADLGDGDMLMMMEWHSDEDVPYLYLTARYQPPFLLFDDPGYLADNIDAYRDRFGDDIELVRDDSKFNDSMRITSIQAARNAVAFYRGVAERDSMTIRYRIDPAP